MALSLPYQSPPYQSPPYQTREASPARASPAPDRLDAADPPPPAPPPPTGRGVPLARHAPPRRRQSCPLRWVRRRRGEAASSADQHRTSVARDALTSHEFSHHVTARLALDALTSH